MSFSYFRLPDYEFGGNLFVLAAGENGAAALNAARKVFPHNVQGLLLTDQPPSRLPDGWLAFPLDAPLTVSHVFGAFFLDMNKLSKEMRRTLLRRALLYALGQAFFAIHGNAAVRREAFERLKKGFNHLQACVLRQTLFARPLSEGSATQQDEPPACQGDIAQALQMTYLIEGKRWLNLPRPLDKENIRRVVRPQYFSPETFGPARLRAALQWPQDTVEGSRVAFQAPTLPFSPAMRAAALVAGLLGTVRLHQGNQEMVLRGRTLRAVRQTIVDTVDGKGEEAVEVHDFASDVIVLNPHEGSLEHIEVGTEAFLRFLDHWGPALAGAMRRAYPAGYDPHQRPFWDALFPHLVRDIVSPFRGLYVQPLEGMSTARLTDHQAHVAAAVVMYLLGHRSLRPEVRADSRSLPLKGSPSILLHGEPGVGKTVILATVLRAMARDFAWRRHKVMGKDARWPVFAWITPPGNVEHIARVVKDVAPEFHVFFVQSAHGSQRQLMAADGRVAVDQALAHLETLTRPSLLIFSRPRLRERVSTRPAAKPSRHGWQCPTCGAAVADTDEKIPKRCPVCHAPLYQWDDDSTVGITTALLRGIRQHRLLPYLLIVDEVHEDGARDSQQARAAERLMGLFHRTVAMTGTVGGTAEALFYILRRMFPHRFPRGGDNPLKSKNAFVRRFGRYTSGPEGIRALPGTSPEVAAGIMAPSTLYLALPDLGIPLPDREEYLVGVTLFPQEQEAYAEIVDAARGYVSLAGAADERRISAWGAAASLLQVAPSAWHHPMTAPWSPYRRCAVCGKPMRACNHPFLVEGELAKAVLPSDRFVFPDDEAAKDTLPPKLVEEPFLTSKEAALVDIVRKEASEGRRVLVFAKHTGKYALGSRLTQVLSAQGFRAVDFTGVDAAHLLQAVRSMPPDTQVGVMGMNAGVGLNLAVFHTVVFFEPVYSGRKMIQASRRVDRATQTQTVRAYYLYARGTGEEAVMARALSKMVAVLLTGGMDAGGIGALASSLGHERSPWEQMLDVIQGRSSGLDTAVEELRTAWSQARKPSIHFPPIPESVREAYTPKRKSPDASPSATAEGVQASLFGAPLGKQRRSGRRHKKAPSSQSGGVQLSLFGNDS